MGYFGTYLVLESLKDVDANGWEQGYINMKEGVHKTLRDQETGLIVGMTTSKPKPNMAQSFVSSVFGKATTNVGTKYNIGFMESKEEQKQECYASTFSLINIVHTNFVNIIVIIMID